MMNLIIRSISVIAFIVFGARVVVVVNADNEMSVLSALRVAYPEWKPRGIVDVGANSGGWTRAVQAEHLYAGVKTFMVEAFKDNAHYLEDTKKGFKEGIVDYGIAVLSSTDDETIKFHSIPGGFTTGNSIFVEKSEHYEEGKAKVDLLKTAKLDTVLKGKMEYVDYLKLDVQGAELVVLKGATETLKKVTFVQLEVSVIQYNKGGACFHELDEFLRQHGFYFYDSGDYNRIEHAFHTKAIGQYDTLYIKPSSDYLPTWLVENNATFCGSGGPAGSKQVLTGGGGIRRGESMLSVNDNEKKFSGNSLFGAAFVFIGGYLVGRLTSGSKGLRKSE